MTNASLEFRIKLYLFSGKSFGLWLKSRLEFTLFYRPTLICMPVFECAAEWTLGTPPFPIMEMGNFRPFSWVVELSRVTVRLSGPNEEDCACVLTGANEFCRLSGFMFCFVSILRELSRFYLETIRLLSPIDDALVGNCILLAELHAALCLYLSNIYSISIGGLPSLSYLKRLRTQTSVGTYC